MALSSYGYQGRDRQRNQGIIQWHGQGCVERLRGLEDPNLSLSIPSDVQLAPTSPKLVEGASLLKNPSTPLPGLLQGLKTPAIAVFWP